MFFDTFDMLCKRKGVSCKRACTEMGLSNSTATKWKKTGATPEGGTLVKVAQYFNVSVASLLTGAPDIGELAAVDPLLAPITDEQLKFALWGDTKDITDADLEDVRNFAAFIRQRKEQK